MLEKIKKTFFHNIRLVFLLNLNTFTILILKKFMSFFKFIKSKIALTKMKPENKVINQE